MTAFRQTPEFYFIFATIVVLESVLMWFWLKPINSLGVLWRVVLLNAVSSLAGDALFRLGWTPMSGELWKQAIPFFLLTITLEGPMARVAFRRRLTTWKRTMLVIISANVASYALLMVIDRPVRKAWLDNLRAKDQQILAQWTNTQLLADAPGRIYATESMSGGPPHRLKYFDFAAMRWHSVSNSPSIDPRYWHVEGDLLAFLTYGDAASRGLVKLTTLPDCAAVQDFCLPTTSYRYDSVWDIAISPDRAKLAVLVLLHEIRAPLSGSTYQVMGKSCSLAVFDIATGAMSLCPRKAAHTLCWLPDSRTVLFHSLRDEKLHELTQVPKALMRGRNLRKRDNPFHDVPLFAYHLDSGVVEPFADTPSPHLAADANRLVFKSGPDALGTFNLGDNTVVRIPVGRTGASGDFAPSPDGRFSLVPLVLNRPVSYWGHPTIVDLHDPSRRYYFGPTIYRVVWARTDQVARGR